jgi:DNA primase
MKAPTGFKMTDRGDRVEWSEMKDRIDLGLVATALLGVAPGRRGERGLWWKCPFHDDKNPSFRVDARKGYWKCFGCGEHGDAASLVMRLRGLAFPEAIRQLAEHADVVPASSSRPCSPLGGKPAAPRPPTASPTKAPERPPETPSGLPPADALALVQDAEQRLWAPTGEGADALAYLKDRGLTEATIKAARLGWTPDTSIPIAGGARFWRIRGVTLPWFHDNRLTRLKIRRLGEVKGTRYVEAYRDRPLIYPDPAAVRPGEPLVVSEGEFDTLLLHQELADLEVSVVTLGSASARPDATTLGRLLTAPVWYLAMDADPAGDRAASGWPNRAVRVRPPAGKDWGDTHKAGIDLRRWWVESVFVDVFDREERAAIQWEGCP